MAGARQIDGLVKDQAGQPLQGYRVRAWDEDWPDSNDFMGEATTNPNGYYLINYAGGHWDPGPHSITTWRPDAFVVAEAQNQFGQWSRVARSGTYNDHRLANGLTINLTVNVLPSLSKNTGFDPLKYGFHFPNSFAVTPQVLGLQLGTWNMGFCGGMVAGALNRFNKKIAAPADTVTPVQGTPLFNELLTRQKASMPASTIATILTWQSSPDQSHTLAPHSVGWRTKQQWPLLKARLDQGKPTDLVLIRVEGVAADPSRNHQVLAYAYDWVGATRDLTIHAYDPNHADTSVQLKMNFGLPHNDIHARQSTGERLRGFFVNLNGDVAAA